MNERPSQIVGVLVVFILGSGLLVAQKVDERKVADLEKKVAESDSKVKAQVASLRELYRRLDRDISAARQSDDGKRLVAELSRVLEMPLAEARKSVEKPTVQNRQKALAQLKKSIPEVLSKLETATLKSIAEVVSSRVQSVLQEPQNLMDVLGLTNDEIAHRALFPLLDTTVAFHTRWNSFFADPLKEVNTYKALFVENEKLRSELNIAKDPVLLFTSGAPPGFARVPSGSYVMHSNAGFFEGRKKERSIALQRDVFIALCEVTNQDYFAWIQSLPAGEREPHLPRDQDSRHLWEVDLSTTHRTPAADTLRLPAVGMAFDSAVLYAKSKGCRLPTEEEWCAMAGGKEGRNYPWGDAWQPRCAIDREAGKLAPQEVGLIKEGRGPFGHYDVSGNVMEWVATYENGKPVPLEKYEPGNIVVRGGSFLSSKTDVGTGWLWLRRSRAEYDRETGIRLAMDVDAVPSGTGK